VKGLLNLGSPRRRVGVDPVCEQASNMDLNMALENDVLKVDGRIDFTKCENMEPAY
jgi:hypothetical protein